MNSHTSRVLVFMTVIAFALVTMIVIKVMGTEFPYLYDLVHGAVAVLAYLAFNASTRLQQKSYLGYLSQACLSGYLMWLSSSQESFGLHPTAVAMVFFVSMMILNMCTDSCLCALKRIDHVVAKRRMACCSFLTILCIGAYASLPRISGLISGSSQQVAETPSVAESLSRDRDQDRGEGKSAASGREVAEASLLPKALPYNPLLPLDGDEPKIDLEKLVDEGMSLLSGNETAKAASLQSVTYKSDVTAAHSISKSVLNRMLKGVLRGKADLFIQEGARHNLSPAFLAAVSMHESGNGTSSMAREKNNVMGVYDSKNSRYRTFDSVDECVRYMSSQLAANYVRRGKKTIGAIQRVYAPVGAANDPKSLNGEWTKGVVTYLNKILREQSDSMAIASVSE